MRIKPEKLSNISIFFLCIAPIIVLWYCLFIFNPNNIDNVVLYIFVIIADIISITVLLSLWITILLDVLVPDHHHGNQYKFDPHFAMLKHKVDVVVPCAGEPIDVVRETLVNAVAIKYPHNTYVFDDSKSEEIKNIAASLGVGYIVRDGRNFAKSGNINSGLRQLTGDFFLVLDADQIAEPDILQHLLPAMADPEIALVQSPQFFSNTEYFIARGTAQAQEIFYRFVMPAKNISNSVFCVGTNVLYRREAINQIKGLAYMNHSEDIWTALLLHEKGWKSVFINKVLAKGTAPATIKSYFRQQLRWSKGGLGMLLHHNALHNSKLTIDQKFQYFMSNMFYLVGVSILVYVMMPILYLLFEIKPLKTEDGALWLLHYLPYFSLYLILSVLLIKKLHLATIATAFASFYPYLLGLWQNFFGAKTFKWVTTTSKKNAQDVLMGWIWPHVFILLLSAWALIIGWINPQDTVTTTYNSFWVLWNAYLIGLFIYSDNRKVQS